MPSGLPIPYSPYESLFFSMGICKSYFNVFGLVNSAIMLGRFFSLILVFDILSKIMFFGLF